MNNPLSQPCRRLHAYFSLYANADCFAFCIREISGYTEIPLDTVRNDFSVLMANGLLSPADEKSADLKEILSKHHLPFTIWDSLWDPLSKKRKDELSKIQFLLSNGCLDDVPFILIQPQRINYDSYQLSFNSEEYSAWQYIQTAGKYDLCNIPIVIKDIYAPTSASVIANLDICNEAIDERKDIQFYYRTANGNFINVTISPLKILYDSNEGLYAILSIENNKLYIYRLDRIISSVQKQKIGPKNIFPSDLMKILPTVWGMNFTEAPCHVKVRFYNEANVWRKVRRDLHQRIQNRDPESHLYEKNGFLYYEDDVRGIKSFRSWIYSYGSSAIIIAPKTLQQEIIASLLERQERLSDGTHP